MVNKNLFVYEYEEHIVIVDCGIGFPESEQLGIDVVIPDISYLKDKLKHIRGIVITHGHEDHYGALPYVLEDLDFPPVYTSKLVNGFTQVKLKEHGLLKRARLHIFPTDDSFSLGCFNFTPYRVNHSIPDAFGFFIKTPVGNIVHASDFKFDWTPVDGKKFEIGKLARLAQEGTRCLLTDCLGANSEGYTRSELFIQDTFEEEIENAPRQVFITTVSSNISRIQQAVNASRKFGRKVAFMGMSILQNTEVARNLGYLDISSKDIVPIEKIHSYPDEKLTVLIAGSYGQSSSSLARVASDSHTLIKLKPSAVVIFSADPIPGVYDQVGALIDKLVERGARVAYSEIQENLHVSGHGSQGDLSILAGIVRPDYFVPIGGSPRHQRAYAQLVERMGFARGNVLELRDGEGIIISPNSVEQKKMVSLTDVFVDGSSVGDVGKVVLHDRQVMAEEGIFIVIIKKDARGMLRDSVDVISRGFVYMAISDKLVGNAKDIAKQAIRNKKASDWNHVRGQIEKQLSGFLYRKTKRNPMVLPVLVD